MNQSEVWIQVKTPAICCHRSLRLSGWRISASNKTDLLHRVMSVLSFCVYFHVYTPTLYIRHLTCATLSALTSSRGTQSLTSQSSAQILKSCLEIFHGFLGTCHTHVHGRKGNGWGCAHRRCFTASASLSFRCWHAAVNYSKVLHHMLMSERRALSLQDSSNAVKSFNHFTSWTGAWFIKSWQKIFMFFNNKSLCPKRALNRRISTT